MLKELPEIVIVDDDLEDRFLVKSAFEENGLFHAVHTISDAGHLFEFLSIHPDKTGNLVILLDLHMPRENGISTLSSLKQNDTWKDIPVVIYTGIHDKTLVPVCYENGARACILKPNNYNEMMQVGMALSSAFTEKDQNLESLLPVLT